MDLLIRKMNIQDDEPVLQAFRADAEFMSRQGTVRCLSELKTT